MNFKYVEENEIIYKELSKSCRDDRDGARWNILQQRSTVSHSGTF